MGIWDICRGTIINISDASHQEVQHLTLWQSYNMDTSITLEIFWLYTKARKGWQIDNWCLHDKKSGHKWTYINSFYKKSCSLPDSRPALPCPWTCRAAPWWTSPTWWCLRASPRCLPTSALLQLCPWWYPVSRSCQTKRMKGKNEWSNSCIVYMYLIQSEGQKYLYNCKFDPFSLFLQSDPFTNNTLHIQNISRFLLQNNHIFYLCENCGVALL